MSDLLEALKDTNRLVEAIIDPIASQIHADTLKNATTRAQLLTDRIIEASRQASAAQAKEPASRADSLSKAITFALNELEHPEHSTTYRTDAIRILKAAINGATPCTHNPPSHAAARSAARQPTSCT